DDSGCPVTKPTKSGFGICDQAWYCADFIDARAIVGRAEDAVPENRDRIARGQQAVEVEVGLCWVATVIREQERSVSHVCYSLGARSGRTHSVTGRARAH